MNKFVAISVAASLAASLCVLAAEAAAADVATASVRVTGEKMDSGLGDLPHYSKWADPTGKNPLQAHGVQSSEKKQSDAAAVKSDGQQTQGLAVQVSQSK